MKRPEPIVNVDRGTLTESVHYGHIVVMNNLGKQLYHLGNPTLKTFARSTAKLFQTIPLVESGASHYYKLTPEEIAIMCSSHNGEPRHTAIVQSIINKLQLNAELLQCGIHDPYDSKTKEALLQSHQQPTVLHNNCSGKHAGMLALAAFIKSSLTDYLSPSHPIQQMMMDTLCDLAQITKDEITLAIDGCGVPVYGLQLNQLALAFARFGNPKALSSKRAAACKQIIQSVINNPFYLAGSHRFDTRLIEVTKGRIVGKMGAEGVYGITIPKESIGVIIKIEDGAKRAIHPAALEALKQLALLTASELEQLNSFHTKSLINHRNELVGRIESIFKLRSD